MYVWMLWGKAVALLRYHSKVNALAQVSPFKTLDFMLPHVVSITIDSKRLPKRRGGSTRHEARHGDMLAGVLI